MLVTSKALDVKHHFDHVGEPDLVTVRDLKFPYSKYKVAYKDAPKYLKEVASFKQKTAWHNPKAENWCEPYTDRCLVRAAFKAKRAGLVSERWFASCLGVHMDLMVREAGTIQWH